MPLEAEFLNETGLGGNNGMTDFKEILGFSVQADGTLVWNCRASNYAAATKLSSCR